MSTGEAVSGVFTHMLHALDLRDWQAVRDAFADHVDIDYSSLSGVPAATVSSDEQVGGWRRAYHRIAGAPGGDVWMVAGLYHVRFVHRRAGWRIIGLALKVTYQDGNLDLPRIARGRAAPPTPIPATP